MNTIVIGPQHSCTRLIVGLTFSIYYRYIHQIVARLCDQFNEYAVNIYKGYKKWQSKWLLMILRLKSVTSQDSFFIRVGSFFMSMKDLGLVSSKLFFLEAFPPKLIINSFSNFCMKSTWLPLQPVSTEMWWPRSLCLLKSLRLWAVATLTIGDLKEAGDFYEFCSLLGVC